VTVLLPGFLWAAARSDPSFSVAAVKEEIVREHPGLTPEVEEVSEGTQGGVRVRIRFDRIEAALRFLASPSRVAANGGEVQVRPFFKTLRLSEEGGLWSRRYVFEAETDPAALADTVGTSGEALQLGADDAMLAAASLVNFRFSLTLPRPIAVAEGGEGSPALSEDRRTVTWTLPIHQVHKLRAESEPSLAWRSAGFVGAAAVLLIGGVAYALWVRRRTAW
jgi:hypothetical protein